MREIKFRAWDKKCKEMIYKVPVNTVGQHAYLGEDADLMQYTGLHDKNGKEIYEGDIVGEKGSAYTVEFEDGMFILAHSTPLIDWIYARKRQSIETEIIGNIYENPELKEV